MLADQFKLCVNFSVGQIRSQILHEFLSDIEFGLAGAPNAHVVSADSGHLELVSVGTQLDDVS